SRVKIPHVRFPLWHYCPRCFRMAKASLFGQQPQCEGCGSGRRGGRRMIPVRIVAICELGHIEDFPFQAWIGCSCSETTRRLYFKAGRSAASLAGIKINCQNCGRERSLAGSFEEDALSGIAVCSGAQPWLGRAHGLHACPRNLQTMQRGGANVYFPLVTSSIYIPPGRGAETETITRVLEIPSVWAALSSAVVDGKPSSAVCTAFAQLYAVDPGALSDAITARLAGSAAVAVATTEEEFRRQEYDVLCNRAGSSLDDLFVERADGSEYGWLGQYVQRVGLVRKLRETRVLVGFSRLMPKTDRGDPAVQPLKVNDTIDWLPAIEVRGEGIFVQLRDDAIRDWLADSSAETRIGSMIVPYNQKRIDRGLGPRPLDARLVMIHTLAHALIKELTFFCGYGSSSLRERLYCNQQDLTRPMEGFLIYTASGDSDGTLGGLVAQGAPGRLERLVQDALARSSWCSNDPVCMESPDGGAFSSNLAACHSCVLLPETSCEEGNRLLDRALLAGTIDDPDIGFFRDLSLGPAV
ncbi:MAG: DrmB family protein, partial [Candidatus Saccharimonadales bacterium]